MFEFGSGVGDRGEARRGEGELAGMVWGMTAPVRRTGKVGAWLFVMLGVLTLVAWAWTESGWLLWPGLLLMALALLAIFGRSEQREVSAAPLGRVSLEAAMREHEMPYYVCVDCCVLMEEHEAIGGRCEHCGSAASCLHVTTIEDAQLALAAVSGPA